MLTTLPKIIGDELLARDENGRLRTRIATVFPRAATIVTLPGIHASQRCAFIDELNRQRAESALPPLTEQEEEFQWRLSVDLVIEGDTILIRPDPQNMAIAFEADELLQLIVSKKKIKFLHVLEPHVRDAIKSRGERWRISPLPQSPEEMARMIAESRIAIGGREIYFYNKTTGTRILTWQDFSSLSTLSDPELYQHLLEIDHHCTQCNRAGNAEVDFFMAGDSHLANHLSQEIAAPLDPAKVRAAFERLRYTFRQAVPPDFQRDDVHNPQWRSRMFAALIGHTDQEVSEESLLGLGAEFFMQIEWVPGGRIEEGELILDPIFEEEADDNCPFDQRITDETARGFIFNFIRDYGDLEYVNIGRVVGSLSSRNPSPGRRSVYLAEVKQRDDDRTILRIIRMQKYGVREHLDEGKDLLSAIMQAEEYTEYILDRRLGCRQLGMNLSHRTMARKVGERYFGRGAMYHGIWIWSTYFERDYVPGLATDKIASWRFADPNFALPFARVLGRAAAPNLIVGRCDVHGMTIFDDGDELVVEDSKGSPIDIVVADHTGTFGEYRRLLAELAPAYARPVNVRAGYLEKPQEFAETYLAAFIERFTQIQQEYRKRQRAFDTLFKHLKRDEGGSFLYRWECVLHRLENASATKLAEIIRQNITP